VARAFPEIFPAIAEAQPEVLAHHLTEAGDVEPAVAAWRRAGEGALQRGAPADALGHLGRGLEVLGALPDGPARDREEFALQLARGHALLTLKGWAAPEAAAAYARATELGERIADPVRLVLLLIGRWTGICTAAGPLAAQVLADQALAASERSGFDPCRVWAHFAQAATNFYAGRFAEASQSADRALALYDEATALVATVDPAVATLAYAALSAWHLGHPDRAKAFADTGVERARRAGPADRAWAEAMASWVALLRRDVAAVVIHADGALAACTEQPNPVHESKVRIYRGWALAERGQADQGSGALRSHLAAFTQTGQRVSLEALVQCLAETVAWAGQLDEALGLLADAERACQGDEHARADTLRIRAEMLAGKGAAQGEVEATFRDALAWARRQGAKSYELRTATRHATWLRDRGRAAEARELLAPIYGWFTEGFDTRDLVEAKALLEELGGPVC
jgi:tetratricopeptide (TPR) repeat protein